MDMLTQLAMRTLICLAVAVLPSAANAEAGWGFACWDQPQQIDGANQGWVNCTVLCNEYSGPPLTFDDVFVADAGGEAMTAGECRDHARTIQDNLNRPPVRLTVSQTAAVDSADVVEEYVAERETVPLEDEPAL